MGYEIEFYGLNKKIKNARRNGFMFNPIRKLTLKNYSNLSNLNIHNYLKLQIPILHQMIFEILSKNTEYLQTHCNDRDNPLHFAIRKWVSFSYLKANCFRKKQN